MLSSRIIFRLMLIRVLPLAWLAGLRLLRLDEQGCFISLRYSYLTKNPFGSVYFAALSMAAEMSTGLPALMFIRNQKLNCSMLVTDFSARYFKKAVGVIVFKFENVALLQQTITDAVNDPLGKAFTAVSRGYNEAGDLVAEMEVHWGFKGRPR